MAHGKQLKEYLKKNGITLESFVDKLSKEKPTARQTVYNWYEKQQFDNDIIARIVKTGLVPEDVFDFKPNNDDNMNELLKEKDKRIALLEKLLAMYEKTEGQVKRK